MSDTEVLAGQDRPDPRDGARNLLFGAGRAVPGARVLIIGEDDPNPHFDPAVARAIAAEAAACGLRPVLELHPAIAASPGLPAPVAAAMAEADLVILVSRLGAQARFAPLPPGGRVVHAIVPTLAHLSDPFATLPHAVRETVHDLLVDRIARARRWRITAPCGTDLSGAVPARQAAAMTPFAFAIFPRLIFPPLTCAGVTGSLTIDRFVTSTATRAYADSVLHLDAPIRARVEDTRIVALDGPAASVARLTDQLGRAAAITGGEPMRINSWHTGINAHTFTTVRAADDPDRWGAVSFGSPRYTHLHAAGHDPGDVAFSVFDATIALDDEELWRDGRFVFTDRADVQAHIPAGLRAALNPAALPPIGL